MVSSNGIADRNEHIYALCACKKERKDAFIPLSKTRLLKPASTILNCLRHAIIQSFRTSDHFTIITCTLSSGAVDTSIRLTIAQPLLMKPSKQMAQCFELIGHRAAASKTTGASVAPGSLQSSLALMLSGEHSSWARTLTLGAEALACGGAPKETSVKMTHCTRRVEASKCTCNRSQIRVLV